MVNKEKHDALEDIVKNEHLAVNADADFCAWLIEGSCIDKRTVIQAYMVWKFKYNWGVENGDEAWLMWYDYGMAKRFGELYDGRCTPTTMYNKMLEVERELRQNKKFDAQ